MRLWLGRCQPPLGLDRVDPRATVKCHLNYSLCGRQGDWNPRWPTGEGRSQDNSQVPWLPLLPDPAF